MFTRTSPVRWKLYLGMEAAHEWPIWDFKSVGIKLLLRSLLGVLSGIVVISVLVEAVEFSLVTATIGEVTTNPIVYFQIRNRLWFLVLKLFYNTLAAVAGGYLAALIAGRAEIKHGIALASLQTVAFVWAILDYEIRRWTPDWVWGALIILTFAGIIGGALIRAQRKAAHLTMERHPGRH